MKVLFVILGGLLGTWAVYLAELRRVKAGTINTNSTELLPGVIPLANFVPFFRLGSLQRGYGKFLTDDMELERKRPGRPRQSKPNPSRRGAKLAKGFDLLRSFIPCYPPEKKLTKIETLRLAIMYIKDLSEIVGKPDLRASPDISLRGSTPVSDRDDSSCSTQPLSEHFIQPVAQSTTPVTGQQRGFHPQPSEQQGASFAFSQGASSSEGLAFDKTSVSFEQGQCHSCLSHFTPECSSLLSNGNVGLLPLSCSGLTSTPSSLACFPAAITQTASPCNQEFFSNFSREFPILF